MQPRNAGVLILCLSILTVAGTALAAAPGETWPNWRGPHYNGASDAENVPERWSTTENVAWVAPMPGPGSSTPIVWDGRIYLTSVDNQTRDLVALCHNLEDGSEIWRRAVSIETAGGRGRNNMASPSAVTDGTRVIFLFGTAQLAAFDLDGEELWQVDLEERTGPWNMLFGYSASPLLHQDTLYLQLMHRNRPIDGPAPDEAAQSYLLALDPATGEERWRHARPSKAQDESLESYTSPMPAGTQPEAILLYGGDALTAHAADSGRELWRWDGFNPSRINHWRVVPSPVVGPGVVYVGAPKGEPVYAIPMDREGEIAPRDSVWQYQTYNTDVPTPLLYRDRLYIVDDRKKGIACVNPRTGEEYWSGELGGRDVFRASPTGADGRIYLINQAGQAYVVGTGDAFELLWETDMGEPDARSTIVALNGRLLIRTAENLYCIGAE